MSCKLFRASDISLVCIQVFDRRAFAGLFVKFSQMQFQSEKKWWACEKTMAGEIIWEGLKWVNESPVSHQHLEILVEYVEIFF